MALIASNVMERASILLQDVDNTRWPAPELRIWLNEAQDELCKLKPSANSRERQIALASGALQSIPADAFALLRVLRNVSGAAVTMIDRDALEDMVPGWQDASIMGSSATVIHAIWDPATPENFYVYPPNNGSGEVIVSCALLPTEVETPLSNADIVDSYVDELDLNEVYSSALVDYVCYRAYAKDSADPAAAQRALSYRQSFMVAVGAKQASETAINPDTTQGA